MDDEFYSVETKFKVEFYDVDSMQVAWHGNYVKFMEIGRCALLDKIGYGYKEMEKSGYAFPVTTINLKYIRPLHFNETATIKSALVEYENRIKIKYEIYNENGELATKAESTQMAVRMEDNESLFECPAVFTDKVKELLK